MKHWIGALLLLLAGVAAAQQDGPPNAILLIAKPALQDPNFRQTVVLVTQAADSSTIGVILNRPGASRHEGTGEPVYLGGPVMPQVTVALFRSATLPGSAAFPLLKDIYLSMHPDNIGALLAGTGATYRLYTGFSGWAPRQLESELERDGWHVLPATEDVVFRKNTEGLWRELLEKAQRGKTPHVQRREHRYTFTYEAGAPQLFRHCAAVAGGCGERPGAG